MASKPTIASSRWADQVGANLVSPTGGERDLGFQGGTAAASGKVNWQIHELYLWALYLSDQALTGDLSITGTYTQAVQTTIVPHQLPGFDPLGANGAGVFIPIGTTAGKGYYAQIASTVGRVIKAVRARINDEVTSTVKVGLASNDPFFGAPPVFQSVADTAGSTSSASNASGGLQELEKSGLTVPMLTNVTYFLFVRLATGTDATCRLWGLEYDWV